MELALLISLVPVAGVEPATDYKSFFPEKARSSRFAIASVGLVAKPARSREPQRGSLLAALVATEKWMPRKRQWHHRSRGFGHVRDSARDRVRQSPPLIFGRIQIAKEFILDSSRPTAGRYSIAGIVANAILMWTCGLRYPKRASIRSARDTLQGERDERKPVLWGSSRRGQIWSWLRLSASHHDFIFGEPLDPVGDHRWNFGLAVCGLFRAFSRMTPPTLKLSLIGKGSPARPARSIILLGQPVESF
jgi:hypothetical protein